MVQTFPEPATHSDLMYIFVKGYLGKKCGVPPPPAPVAFLKARKVLQSKKFPQSQKAKLERFVLVGN